MLLYITFESGCAKWQFCFAKDRASDISRGRRAAKSRQIHEIPQNSQKHAKYRKIRTGRNLIKYMSVQQFWNLSQLLGVFTCRNSQIHLKTSSRKHANNVPKLPGVDYVVKNWALAMMLKALPLVHFWSVLLLKEQMMTSVRKTLKTLV